MAEWRDGGRSPGVAVIEADDEEAGEARVHLFVATLGYSRRLHSALGCRSPDVIRSVEGLARSAPWRVRQ
jgi:hypothetical protein